MFLSLRTRLLVLTATLLAGAGSARASDGGWITFKNNTQQVVVVQETVVCNGETKRGKPIRMLPGETLREFQATPAVRKFEVFDGRNPGKPLFSGNLNCLAAQQTFSIASDGKTLTVTPAPVARASGESEPVPKK
jgi:hypothetical protein